jgi:pyruvate/2-oxoacid:ferredoxin oxidoreductase alpha subunit
MLSTALLTRLIVADFPMAQTASHWARGATAWKYSVIMMAAASSPVVAVMKPALTAVARMRAPMVYRSTKRGLRRTTRHRPSDSKEQRDG